MKKTFGYVLIGVGVVALFKMFTSDSFHGGVEIFGGLIGASLFTFLPGYFLVRNKKNFHEPDSK